MVEIHETVQEIRVPKYVDQPKERRSKSIVREDYRHQLLSLAFLRTGSSSACARRMRTHYSRSLITCRVKPPSAVGVGDRRKAATGSRCGPDLCTFDHRSAQRRFRIMSNVEELERALDFPWDKWTVFLHPEQRQWVEKDYSGPVRVLGTAGTGKTVVALHRAVHLAGRLGIRASYSQRFPSPLPMRLPWHCDGSLAMSPYSRARIDVHSMES